MRRRRERERPPSTQHAGCYVHPVEPSVGTCTRCDNQVCESCRVAVGDTTYCVRCAMYMAGVTTRRP